MLQQIGIWRRVAADNASRTLAVISHPLGPSTISRHENWNLTGKKPSPLGKVAERKRGRKRCIPFRRNACGHRTLYRPLPSALRAATFPKGEGIGFAKFQFIKRLSHTEFVWPCIGCLMGKPADSSALIPLDFSSGFVYNSHDNQIGQFVTILSVNKTRDLQSDGRICAHFVLLWARTAPIFLFLEE